MRKIAVVILLAVFAALGSTTVFAQDEAVECVPNALILVSDAGNRYAWCLFYENGMTMDLTIAHSGKVFAQVVFSREEGVAWPLVAWDEFDSGQNALSVALGGGVLVSIASTRLSNFTVDWRNGPSLFANIDGVNIGVSMLESPAGLHYGWERAAVVAPVIQQ